MSSPIGVTRLPHRDNELPTLDEIPRGHPVSRQARPIIALTGPASSRRSGMATGLAMPDTIVVIFLKPLLPATGGNVSDAIICFRDRRNEPWVFTRRRNSPCNRSIVFVVRKVFHYGFGNSKKVSSSVGPVRVRAFMPLRLPRR